MRTLLVVGGNGLLGRGLRKALEQEYSVVVNDIEEGLFSLSASSIRKYRASAIINLAVVADTQRPFISVGGSSWVTNVLGTEHLRGIAEELDLPLVHLSTREVLGPVFTKDDVLEVGGLFRPKWLVPETHPQNPQSDYGQTKLISEWIVTSWRKGYVIRIATPYTDEVPPNGGGLLPALVRHSLARRPVRLTQEGKQFRDPVHTDDIAELIKRIIGTQPQAQLFNCAHGGDNLISLVEIVRILNEEAVVQGVDGGDLGFAFDTSRAADMVGWTPRVKVRDRLRLLSANWSEKER